MNSLKHKLVISYGLLIVVIFTISLWSAYNFVSSSSSHISISDSDIFNFNPNFNYSYEFWIKPSTITEWNSVWTQQSSTNPNDFFIIYAQTTTDPGWGAVTKGISAGIGTGSANIFQRTKNNVIDVNNYYHIVITYNSSKVQSQRFNIFVQLNNFLIIF